MSRRALCVIVSMLFLFNLGMINVSEHTEADYQLAPPVTFSYDNGTFHWVGDMAISGLNYFNDSIIDVRGNITINTNAQVFLHHTILRMNVTADNQYYQINMYHNSKLYVLDGSIITDSIFDEDIRTGEKPDFRYQIYNDGGTLTIKDSLIEEAGPKYREGIYGYDYSGDKSMRFIMENSTFRESSYGIYLYNGYDVLIKNSEIYNCSDRAVYLSGCYDSKLINVTFENVTSFYNVQFNYCYGTTYFLNCRINNTKGYGLYLNYGDNYYVENNSITNVYSNAINIYSKDKKINVKNNFINHTSGYGIYVYKPQDSIISHNFINDSYSGVMVYFGVRIVISRNDIMNSSKSGIYLKKCMDTFVRNNHVNYSSNDYIMKVEGDNTYRRVTIENNSFTRAYMGIYLAGAEYYAGYDSVIKNNIIKGRSGVGEGIKIKKYYFNRLENNVISNFDYGIFGEFTSFHSYDITEIYGGEISDSGSNDLYLKGQCYVHMYNVSFDTSNMNLVYSDFRWPYVRIYFNVDVLVKDITGPVGGARVTIVDTSFGNKEKITKPTDKTGWARSIRVLYAYKYGTSTIKTYGPYNFSSDVSGDVAEAPENYYIDSYKIVQINHSIDTFPTPPVNLRLEVDYDTIILKWECYVNDLEMYKVFKNNTVGGWDLVGIGIPSGPQVTLTYQDLNQANRLVEFKYKVHHVDKAIQEELNDEWILFNDWVITDYKTIVSQSIQLNGSLIVEHGGYLNLRNTSVLMNGTSYYPGIKAIEVRDGGLLVIKDLDDDNHTKSDQSFINASETMGYYNFFVEKGGHLEIYNSWIQNASNRVYWGDMNIYIESDNCTIMNSTIITKATRAINIESSENIIIDGNKILKESNDVDFYFGIYIHDSEGVVIANNTIENASTACMDIFESSDLTLSNNIFELKEGSLQSYKYGLGLFQTEHVLIEGNIFDGPNVGIKLVNNENLEINGNNFANCSVEAIESSDSTNLIIESNTIKIKNEKQWIGYGFILIDSTNLEIKNNTMSGFSQSAKENCGIYLEQFNKLFIYNNNIRDATVGIQLSNKNAHSINDILIAGNIIHDLKTANNCAIQMYGSSQMIVVANFFYNVNKAFGQESTQDIVYDGNVFWSNVTYGYFIRYGSTALIINATVNELPEYTIYLNFSSEVDIIDAKFNLTSLRLSDKTCEARIYWTINVRIKDHYGNYIPDIFLRIRSIVGTILHESTTDEAGYIRNVVIMERVQLYADNISFTPTSFEAEFENHTAYMELSINNAQNVTLQLGNEAPNVYNIVIYPQFPKTTDDLNLNTEYTFLDTENDMERGTYYKWFKNGIHIPELDNYTTVPWTYTKKGELWYCQVTPCDNIDFGNPGNSITVLIFNTKPSVSDVVLSPAAPDGLQDLYVNYSYNDIDSDEELGTQYHWFADSGTGSELRVTTSMPVLPSSYTSKGEVWYVEVEPKDGEDSGERFKSNDISVGNTVPFVENAYIVPADPSTSDNITVIYTFIDLDHDIEAKSTYRWLKWYPGLPEYIDYIEAGFKTKSVPSKFLTRGEIWMCQVTPFDGEEYGGTVNSTAVEIGNTPPAISDIYFEPADPKTTDNITVRYRFSDRDGDLENSSAYEWFKVIDGKLVKTGLKVKTLPALFSTTGETWVCKITPFDGISFGEMVESPYVSIGNKDPIAVGLAIMPVQPDTTENLTAYYTYQDDDGDSENLTTIKWYKDGVHQPRFDDSLSIPWTETSKNELWYFSVTPGDGKTTGETYSCQPVKIINSPPKILNGQINPKIAFTDDDLKIDFDVIDADGDKIQSMEISWYLDGEIQGFYQDKATIPAWETTKGQLWKCQLRVNDGVDESDVFETKSVVIRNSPPQIIDYYPAQPVLELDEMKSLSFSIQVDDPDNDKLVYQWRENKGIVPDYDQSYTLKTNFDSAGNYTINVTVQDPGTGSALVSMEWRVTVRNINRKPTLSPNEPLDQNPEITIDETLNFHVTYSDPDTDDEVRLRWYIAGDLDDDFTDEATYIYHPKSVGKHTVKAEVDDGSETVSWTWNVTVKKSTAREDEYLGLKWDQWSIILEGLVVGVTGLVAFIGFLKLRKKKGALQHYMKEIETNMKTWKEHPDEAENNLLNLSETIETDFTHGKIEDFHYFLLDRQIKESLREIRQTKIKRDFTSLPENLRKELNMMLEDGRITEKEYQSFVGTISKSDGISAEDKEGLRRLMRTWKDVDTADAGKKVIVKPSSVKKKIHKSQFEAEQLGWEDFSGDETQEKEPSRNIEDETVVDDKIEQDGKDEEWQENDETDDEEEVWE